MADNKTTYAANLVLTTMLRTTTVYLALFTVMPGETGGGTEVSGNAYARQAVTFSVPVGGQTSNSNTLLYPLSTGPWGTVVGMAIIDASSGGNYLYYGPLTAPIAMSASNLRIQFDPTTIVVQEL